MKIYTRQEWGASRSNGDGTRLSGKARLVLHHTVTAVPGGAQATVEQEKEHMRLLERIGNSKWGSGISYNWVHFPSGRTYAGVSPNVRGTHTGGKNSTLLSVAVVGNYEANKVPASLVASLTALRVHLGKTVGRLQGDGRFVGGHRDFASTACPGKNLYPLIATINSGAAPKPASQPKPSKESLVSQLPTVNLSNAHQRSVKGPVVARIQGLLLAAGYGPKGLVGANGRPDGIGGTMTRKFTGQFQVKHKAGDSKGNADYVWGQKSWKAGLGV